MRQHLFQMNGKRQITNILVESKITYCYKCLSILTESKVKDHNGNEYCDSYCRREYFIENNKETNARFNEWSGKD